MKEEDSNWFSKWEEELPPSNELMPLSQTLITAELATAFDIQSPGTSGGNTPLSLFHHHRSSSPTQLLHGCHNYMGQQRSSSAPQPPPTGPNSSELDSSSRGSGGGGGGALGAEETARTLKRPRLVWTPQLHKRFVDAVAHLGIKNAVPKTIMQLMSVDGLTRENVASHLQKYRLYLKRVQGHNNGGVSGDLATGQLFSSQSIPAHFLHQASPSTGGGGGGARPNSDHFMSYMSVAVLHHQQMAATMAGHPQYAHHRKIDHHFGTDRGGGQLEMPFWSRQAQLSPTRNGHVGMLQKSGRYGEGMESATANNSRKVLTLFPTGD